MPAPRPSGPASKRPPFPWPFTHAAASSHSDVRGGVPLPPGSWGFWGNGHPCSTSPESPRPVKVPAPKTWGNWPPRTPPGRNQVGRNQQPKSPEAASRLRQVQMQDEHWHFEYEQHQSQLEAWMQAQRDEFQQIYAPQAPGSPCYSPRSSPGSPRRSPPGSPACPGSPLSSPRCSHPSNIEMSPGTPRINKHTDEASLKSPNRAPKPSPKSSRAGMRSPKATAVAPPGSPGSPRQKVSPQDTEVKSPKQTRPSPMKASASQEDMLCDALLQKTATLSVYEAEMPAREPQQKTKALAVCSSAAPSPRLHDKKSTVALAGSPTQICEKTSITDLASSSTDPAEIQLDTIRSPRLYQKTSNADSVAFMNTTGETTDAPMQDQPVSEAPVHCGRAAAPPATVVRRRIRSKTPPQSLGYPYDHMLPRRRLYGKQPPPPGMAASAPPVRGRKRRASAPAALRTPLGFATATPRRRIRGKQPPPQPVVIWAPRRSEAGDSAQGDELVAAEVAPRRRITGKQPPPDVMRYPGTPPPRWDKEQVTAVQGALESAEKLRLNTARRRNAAPKEVGQFVVVIGDGWGGGGSCPHQAIVTEVEDTTYNVALIKGDQVLRRTRVLKEFCEAVGPASPNWPGVEAGGSTSCRTQDGEPAKKRGRSAPPKVSRSLTQAGRGRASC